MRKMNISQELLALEVHTRGKHWRLFVGRCVRRLFPGFRLNRRLASLIGRSVKVSVMGKMLDLDLRDEAVSSAIYVEGVWEPCETSFVEKILRPGMVFVDVGAHVGYYTLLASGIVGSGGRVYAFEPDPGNLAFLRRNVRNNQCQNVVVEHKAVTASSGQLLLYQSANNFGDHRIYEPTDEPAKPREKRRSIVSVDAVSLDAYFERNPRRIDFLKMDIQGAEYSAFVGMRGVLRRNPEIIVLSEFWPSGLSQAGVPPELFLSEAQRCGFGLYRLDQNGPHQASIAEIMQSVSSGAYASLVFSRERLLL